MRALTLVVVAIAGLAGCVYDPYSGYVYYPLASAATVVVTDTDFVPCRYGGHYYRYPYGGYGHSRYYRARPYYRGW